MDDDRQRCRKIINSLDCAVSLKLNEYTYVVNRSRRSVPSRQVTHRRCCRPSSPTSAVMMKPFSYTMVAIRVTYDVHGPLHHRILRNFFLFVCFMNCKSSGGWALFKNFFLLLVLCISNTHKEKEKKRLLVVSNLLSLN